VGTVTRRSGVYTILCKDTRVLTGLKLGADVLQSLVSMFEHLFSMLAVAPMHGKVGGNELCLGGTTRFHNVRFPMLNGHAVSHAVFSYTRCKGDAPIIRSISRTGHGDKPTLSLQVLAAG
jgi:hypothetical protein